jgi:3-oxocholest-4-en-26-oyl-CoA dehydrogenase beta subunit
MDLDLTKEQKILKQSAKEFLKKECPTSLLRTMKDDERGYPKEMWRKMAELGWMGVMIPEKFGGIGGNFIDLAILLECMGEVNCPGPFFSTVVMGGLAVLIAGSEEQKKEVLPKIADGKLVFAFAMTEPGMYYDASRVGLKADSRGDSWTLNGVKLFVENAQAADYVLCVARTGGSPGDRDGLTLFMVDGKAPGISCTALQTLAFDKQCEVVFDNVRVDEKHILGTPGKAWDLLEKIQSRAVVAKCAEVLGCIQTAFDLTVAYAKSRKQFDRPIGSFQAVQHHCANMVMDVDGARFITYKAAWEITAGMDSASTASMAKAWTGSAGQRVTILAHQIHGAIGFCEEMDLHLYYRRAKAAETFLGDSDYHLEKVAQQLGL